MASVQADVPEVEEVSSHVDQDKSSNTYCICEPQNIEKEERHDYVEEEEEEEEGPKDSDNITPDHDHEKEEKPDEDEEELLMGSQIVDEGEKPTGGIEFSDEEEYLDDD